VSVLALVLLLQAGAPPPAETAADLPVIVHLADGSSLPLREWSLSYEYLSWPVGSSQVMGTTARRDTRVLWVGNKEVATTGRMLELEHRMVPFDPGIGGSGPPEIPVVNRLRLSAAGGRKEELKPDPPHRDRLLPGGGKNVVVLARSLDLRGVTLTGTRRELCVVSYTSMVECGVQRDGRVVKLEFPAAP
jgi:hypothetical protein